MHPNKCLFFPTALAITTLIGCSAGSGEEGGRVIVSSEEYAGRVIVLSSENGMIAFARFFDISTIGQEIALFQFANDQCILYGNPAEGLDAMDIDVGPDVTLDGPVDLALTRQIDEQGLHYEFIDLSGSYPPGATYTAAITGTASIPATTLGIVRIPGDFELISTDLYVIPDVVRYSPNAGADVIRLEIEGPSGTGACFAEDDGEFDVPSDFLESVGIPATVSAYAQNFDRGTLNGKTIALFGWTQ